MHRPGRILIMDDLERWRSELTEALAETDYHIESAESRREAAALYDSRLFHVLVLDVRMEDEDESNEEGMEFLRQLEGTGRENAVRVIMCTGYSTPDQQDRIREAFREHGVEDFLDKTKFSDDDFQTVIDRSFHEKLKINLDLEVRWQRGLTPEAAVQNLLVAGKRIKKNSPRCELMATELADLLCRLFHDANKLLVEPLAPGRSGAGVLLVKPFYAAGAGRHMVVKFGGYKQIDLEYQNFREYVHHFVGGGRSTSVLELRRTPRLGGVAYSFMGTGEGVLEDLAAFYQGNEIEQITPILDGLFRETCGAWYANLGQLRLMNLKEHYTEAMDLRPGRLQQGRNEIRKTVQGKEQLLFTELSERRELPNPIPALTGRSWDFSTYECIVHGDLNPHNVFVDQEGHTWLIDFQQTGRGHALRDIIQLDCAIRIELLTPDEAGLDERFDLEQALLGLEGFPTDGPAPEPASLTNPAVQKAFAACHHLRYIAGTIVANNPEASLKEFYVGAAYFALNYLRFNSLDVRIREHAMLSASLLVRHLSP